MKHGWGSFIFNFLWGVGIFIAVAVGAVAPWLAFFGGLNIFYSGCVFGDLIDGKVIR